MIDRQSAAATRTARGFVRLRLSRIVAALAACGAITACSVLGASGGHHDNSAHSAEQYEAELKQWVGHTEAELFRAWGVPTHSQLLSQGGQALEYVRRRGDVVDCTTLFTTNVLGVIDTWTWRGNDCSAPQLGSSSP